MYFATQPRPALTAVCNEDQGGRSWGNTGRAFPESFVMSHVLLRRLLERFQRKASCFRKEVNERLDVLGKKSTKGFMLSERFQRKFTNTKKALGDFFAFPERLPTSATPVLP